MLFKLFLTVSLVAALPAFAYQSERKSEPFDLAGEFVREISALESIRVANEKELKESDSDNGNIAVVIHLCAQMHNELATSIHMLNAMHFAGKEAADASKLLVNLNQMKLERYDQVRKVSALFISSKRDPKIDYGEAAAKLPALRADIEDADKSLSREITQLICLILKDKKEPDWLVIDKEQKAQLMADLEDAFHLSSHEKSLPFFVFAGVLMHGFLEDSKTADQKPLKE